MEIITDIKGKTGMSYAIICSAIRIPLSTLGRWRKRRRENHPLLNRPGPRKVEPFDPAVLETEIKSYWSWGRTKRRGNLCTNDISGLPVRIFRGWWSR
jgi:hypothetical protein